MALEPVRIAADTELTEGIGKSDLLVWAELRPEIA
jgi:hypothetical protein